MNQIIKYTLCIVLFLLFTVNLFSQSWLTSLSCNVNVNDPFLENQSRTDIIRATFKINVEGECTGTLINRNTNDADVGFYFIIARHCLFDGSGNTIDFNATHELIFNYQSPNENTLLTPESNRGIIMEQSDDVQFFNGYEYFHESKLD